MKMSSVLKGHGNEADFLGFLHKLDPHRSLTLPFEPFRFWLRIRGDIRNRKKTPYSPSRESTRLHIGTIFFNPLNKSMVIVNYNLPYFLINWSLKGLI
jgi:hypothetical protein